MDRMCTITHIIKEVALQKISAWIYDHGVLDGGIACSPVTVAPITF
jgi:hypothetical protein